MHRIIKIKQFIFQLLLIGLIISVFQELKAAEFDVVVVVNSENSLTDISHSDLRRLWLGKIDQVDGVKLSPVMSKMQLRTKKIFYRSIHKTKKKLQKYYIREELKGSFSRPKSVKSIELLLSNLVTDTSAISVMNRSEIHDSPDIKILTIDGKNYSDTAYVIK